MGRVSDNLVINTSKSKVDVQTQPEHINISCKAPVAYEKNHQNLENLDFEHSGHIGFQPAGDYVVDKDYVHTDNNYTKEDKEKLKSLQNFSGNASDVTYKDNIGYGVDNVQDALDEAFDTLDNKPEYSDIEDFVSYTAKQNKTSAQKQRARKNIEAKKDVIDLGQIDLADYNDDFDTFMNTLLNEGQYKFFNDIFTYYVEVINLGKAIGQEYCSSEEGYALHYFRTIYFDDTGIFDYATDWDDFITANIANSSYAPKNHVHYKVLNTASTIRTYLDTFNQYGEFSISSTTDKEKYWVFTDYYNVTINGKTEYRRIQRYYSMSEPWKVYSRFGLYNNATKKIDFDEWYINEGVIE